MISEKPLFMGIDAGSSKIRALIFDQKGKLISQASDNPKIYHSNIGWAHYDPQEIWETTAIGLPHIDASGNYRYAADLEFDFDLSGGLPPGQDFIAAFAADNISQ